MKLIEIIKELKVEVSKQNIFQAIVAKQYDMNTRFIKATFVDGTDVIYIPAGPTVKAVINANRPDGQSKGFDGTVNDDGTVTVPLHSWMLEMEGTVICDISIIDTEVDDNKKLTTTAFTLLVEKAAYGGNDVTNDPQYDVMVQLMETCYEASEIAQESLNKSNEALAKSNEANSKYDACVEATENANAVREEIEAGGYIESLKEKNNGEKFSFWVGTEEEYSQDTNDGENIIPNCLYLTTNSEDRNLLDNTVDFVIEQGFDANWSYRKWNSGVAECWGKKDNKVYSITTSHGWGYVSETESFDFPQGLFAGYPAVVMSFDTVGEGVPLINMRNRSPQGVSFILFESINGNRQGVVNIYAKGLWKEVA